MKPSFDVQDLIKKSSADVAVSELAKKGFQKVKVLNRNTINQLIQQAVERVVATRSAEFNDEERRQILEESRREFEGMLKRENQLQAKLLQLTQENERLNGELSELKNQLATGGASSGGGSGLDEIKASIESLAQRISQGLRGGGGADVLSTAGPALEALLDKLGDGGDLESNVGQVEVKKASAGGVAKNLAKLKSLNRGNDTEDS